MRRTTLLALTLALLAAAPSQAQNVELTLFGGYVFDGNFSDSLYYYDYEDVFLDEFAVEESGSFGGDLLFRVDPSLLVGVQYSHQATDLTLDEGFLFPPSQDQFSLPIDLDYIHAVGIWEAPKPGVRPFFGFGMGATILKPEGPFDSETRFSWSFLFGMNAPIAENFGFRLQGRVLSTYIDDNDSFACSPYACYGVDVATLLYQFEASGGFTVRF